MNMNRPGWRWCMGLWAALVACGVAADPVNARVQRAADAFMTKNAIPGMAVALVVDGKSRFYNFGVASKATKKRVDSDTLFELGSISKTFTATLAAYAEVEGRLDLKHPVADYLPAFRDTPFGRVPLRDLATHTAGGFPLQVPDTVHDEDGLTAYLKAWTPRYATGTKRTYANPSIGMLGRVAATRLDMPFAAAMQNVLFPKLGLANTYIDVPEGKRAIYAQGYNGDDQPVRVNPGVLADEAYGVKSSSRDLARFLEVQLGTASVDPALKRAVRATRVGYYQLGSMTQDLVWEQYAWPTPLATLLEGSSNRVVFEDQPVQALTPPRPPREDVLVNKTGGTGGFGAYIAFVPVRRIGLVILTNRAHSTEERLRFAHELLASLDD